MSKGKAICTECGTVLGPKFLPKRFFGKLVAFCSDKCYLSFLHREIDLD